MKKDELFLELQSLGLDLDNKKKKQIEEFCDFLIEENSKTNLTAIKTKEEIYLKHIYDSLTLVKAMDFKTIKNVLDVGSGAGFPGIVIKICFPDLEVTLIEANNKKCEFLKKAIQKLELRKINVVQERAEDYIVQTRETFDLVTARAVANMRILAELCLPFVKLSGNFIAMKSHIDEEVDDAKEAIELLGGSIKEVITLNLPIENSLRTLINIEKIRKTPLEFPRRYDRILNYPLKKNKS